MVAIPRQKTSKPIIPYRNEITEKSYHTDTAIETVNSPVPHSSCYGINLWTLFWPKLSISYAICRYALEQKCTDCKGIQWNNKDVNFLSLVKNQQKWKHSTDGPRWSAPVYSPREKLLPITWHTGRQILTWHLPPQPRSSDHTGCQRVVHVRLYQALIAYFICTFILLFGGGCWPLWVAHILFVGLVNELSENGTAFTHSVSRTSPG